MGNGSWNMRCSSIPGYAYCDHRMALDRQVAEGRLVLPKVEKDTKYADLGTIIHAALQQRLGCKMPRGWQSPEFPVAQSAARLFNNDLNLLTLAVNAAVSAGAAAIPTGTKWTAELAVKLKTILYGHVDLLSADKADLIDIKTTSRKPDHNRIKGEHALQMYGYKMCIPQLRRARILYIDSQAAKWTILTHPIDFDTMESQALLASMSEWVRRSVRRKQGPSWPRLGGHCSGSFCPYIDRCKDKIIPAAGPITEHTRIETPTMESPL